jgi:hypothetical protein
MLIIGLIMLIILNCHIFSNLTPVNNTKPQKFIDLENPQTNEYDNIFLESIIIR